MIRGLYAAATALDSAQQAHAVTAANLANSGTPGYKQQGVRFETFNLQIGRDSPPPADINGTRAIATYTDFRPSSLQQTGSPLDLAINEPDQFFVVQGPNGPMYTRGGSFRLSAQGQVLTQAGYPLLGTDAAISVPEGTAQLNVASDGSITADGVPAGRLRLVRFANTAELQPVGPTHFSAPPTATPQDVSGRVTQGFREVSNVNSAEAMVGMVAATRYYEAAQRAIRAISDSLQLNTRPQG
jgi:flagellar basal-body rod protein FlgF